MLKHFSNDLNYSKNLCLLPYFFLDKGDDLEIRGLERVDLAIRRGAAHGGVSDKATCDESAL